MNVGQFLKKMRKQNDFTIREVVEKSDGILDKTTVSRIERDERGLSLRAAYAFARIYNINLMEICEYVLGKELTVDMVPFDTSREEQKMIEEFRCLSKQRRKSVMEIIHGLCLAGEADPIEVSRKKVKDSMRRNIN